MLSISDWTWPTKRPECANLSVTEISCEFCEFIGSSLRCDPEVGVGFYFGVHEANGLRSEHAIECAKGPVDGTYDERSGVMRGKLQGRCVVDLVVIFVVAV